MTGAEISQPKMDDQQRLAVVVDLVCAFLGNNKIDKSELSGLIATVDGALTKLEKGGEPSEPAVQLVPAVPIRKSVTPDFIVCLDDGKKFRSLKRHLRTLGLTPEDYRRKWGLPPDYPMVAPNYSEARSLLAKKSGLGSRAAAAKAKAKAKAAARAPSRTKGR